MGKWIKILLVVALALSTWWAAKKFWLNRDVTVELMTGERLSGKDIRQPLKVSPGAMFDGNSVVFAVLITDADGRNVREVRLSGDEQVDPPGITITDASGNVVHSGSFQYG